MAFPLLLDNTPIEAAMIAGGVTPLVYDTFTDANATAITAHTPNIDRVGGGWVNMKQHTGTPGSASHTIQSNQLQLKPDLFGAVIDCGQAAIEMIVEWTPAVGQLNRNSIVIRYLNDANMWLVNIREDNGDILLIQFDANTPTTRDSTAYAWLEGTTYTIRVIASGNTITAYVNGVQQVTYTSAFLNTQTKFGLLRATGSDATRFDNFTVNPT